jgi:hypothetical protein
MTIGARLWSTTRLNCDACPRAATTASAVELTLLGSVSLSFSFWYVN